MNISVSACNVLLMRTTELCKSLLSTSQVIKYSVLYIHSFTNLYAKVNLRSCVYMYVETHFLV